MERCRGSRGRKKRVFQSDHGGAAAAASWRSREGSRVEGGGSARRGAPGACAVRPRPRPPPPAAYFSPSGCGRGDPTRAEQPPDPPNLRGLGVRAPVEPPRRCPPRPAARCSKLWPAPPRLGARDEPGKERGAADARSPAICSLALPG